MRAAPTATLLDTTPTIRTTNQFDGTASTFSTSKITDSGISGLIDGFVGMTAGHGVIGFDTTDLIALDAEI